MKTSAVPIHGGGLVGPMRDVVLHDLQRGCPSESTSPNLYFLEELKA